MLGTAATEGAFKGADLAEYRVIHLAVHGFADPTFPDRAALVLLSAPSAGEDGFLQASEIVQLRLNADLVVLSACDTAVGPLQGQEGIANLSRAFLLAGARTVVSTPWQIDDTSSLFLMKRFYAHLLAHRSAGSALTAAKRDMLRTFGREALPYQWAGFTNRRRGGRYRRIGAIAMMSLDFKTRAQILRSIKKRVLAHHVNVGGIDYGAWTERVDGRTAELLGSDLAAFEAGVRQLLAELKTSHTVFYYSIPKELLPQHTINASLRDLARNDDHKWMFLDVFEGGPAHVAGIRPGDILNAVDATACVPSSTPYFAIGHAHTLLVGKLGNGSQKEIVLEVPKRKGTQQRPPIVEPKSPIHAKLGSKIGLLKIPYFPGAMGICERIGCRGS